MRPMQFLNYLGKYFWVEGKNIALSGVGLIQVAPNNTPQLAYITPSFISNCTSLGHSTGHPKSVGRNRILSDAGID